MLMVETENLLIKPLTRNFMTAILENKKTDLEDEGYEITSEWLELETYNYLDIIRSFLPENYKPDGFYTWAVIEKASKKMIGDIGFKGAPNQIGIIDVGYSIVPQFRGKGYATEALKAIVAWAFTLENVKRISADCAETNAPSICVLKNAGFRDMFTEDGQIFWELKK